MYFAFAVSNDKLNTLDLVNLVGVSWGIIGGNILQPASCDGTAHEEAT